MLKRRNERIARSAVLGAALALILTAETVSSSGSSPSAPPRQEPPSSQMPPAQQVEPGAKENTTLARAEAEKLYAKGYEAAQDAKKEQKAGKAGDAKKKFGKALKKFEGAVERDATYFEAWNMVGFCERNLGNLDRAFAAYEKALTLKPDYDEAHEYLGEAYLMSGDVAKAKVELAWLRARDSDEAEELAEKIAEAEGKAATEGNEKLAAPAEQEGSTSDSR